MARFSNGSDSEMSNRITICFASGDVMFEGQSALEIEWDGEEECPPTVRSADSGVFERVSPAPKGQKKAESPRA